MPTNKLALAPALYVGDLDENVQEETLHDFFSRFGPIHFVRIMRDSTTGKSRGYAFINFIHPRDAESAKQYAQYEKIGRKHIRLMFKRNIRDLPPEGNIYVKNVDPHATVKDLHNHFSDIGPILCCKISTNSEGESLGYGYVQYEKPEDAKTAMKTLQGSRLKEKELVLEEFTPKDKRTTGHSRRNIYIKNLPVGKSSTELDKLVTDLFSKYGEIEMKLIKKHPTEEKYSAFICFKDQAAAEKAYTELNEKPVTLSGSDEKIYVNWYQGKAERQRELKRMFSQNLDQTNLYLKNLRPDITEQDIKKAFSQYGKVTSVAVKDWKSPTGEKTARYGFVAFDNASDTKFVLAEAHKNPDIIALYLKGVMPYINIHQPRDRRNEYLLSLRRKMMQTSFMNMGMDMFRPMPFQFPQRRFGSYPQQFPPMNPYRRGGHPKDTRGYKPHPENQKPYVKTGPTKVTNTRQQQQQTTPKTLPKKPEKEQETKANPLITIQSLKSKMTEFLQLDEDKQRQILGELLFPLVRQHAGESLAPKITGMLIDLSVLEVSEILEFLESDELLKERIDEAKSLILSGDA